MAGLMSQHIGGSSTPQSGLLAQQPVGLLQGFPTHTGPEQKPVATKPPRLKYEQDRLRAMIQQQKMAELMSQNIGGGSTPQEGLMPRQPMGSMQGFPTYTGPEQSALFFNASKGYEPVAYNPPRLITPLSIQKYEQDRLRAMIQPVMGHEDSQDSMQGFPTYTGPEKKPVATKPESAQQLKNFSAEDLPNTILKAKSREDVTEDDRVTLVRTYKRLADQVWPDSPLMAKIAIAQAITESDWHVSDLARENNNLFGIKESKSVPGAKGSVSRKTKEQDTKGKESTITAKFSSNSSFLESFIQHRKLLEKHYSKALKKKTFIEVAKALKAGGYATDVDYVNKLNSVAITRRLQK